MNQRVITVLAASLAALACLPWGLVGVGPSQATQVNGPRAIVERYCQLDADGGRLTPEGRKEMARLLVHADVTMPDEVDVIKNYSVSASAMTGERQALVRIDSTHLGFLDTRAARFRQPAPGLHHAGDLTLSLTGDGWKIEGPAPGSSVTIAAARRFVSDLRARTKDPAVKRNADRTLAALRRLR